MISHRFVIDEFRKRFSRFWGPYDYATHIFAFHAYAAIYMAVPKVANSSIKHALWRGFPEDFTNRWTVNSPTTTYAQAKRNEQFKRNLRLLKHEVAKYPGYHVFAFVRNPWDRLVSCYHDKIRSEARRLDGEYYQEAKLRLYERDDFNPTMSFEDFVASVHNTPDRHSNRHFRSQHLFITDRTGRLLPSYIGRFETLHKDFAFVTEKIQLKVENLPHDRKTDRGSYRDYYTPRLKDLVAERYASDISLFKYTY